VEFGDYDRERRGSSGEAIDSSWAGETSTRPRVHREHGGAGGRMVSGRNEQRSRHHSKDIQDLCQITGVLEHQHQRTKQDGRER